jgi:S1-C subfamily serine protease
MLLIGCVNQQAFDDRAQAEAAHGIPASLEPWRHQRLSGRPAIDFPLRRTYQLTGAGGFVGTAVSITTDGYLLTAAHCVGQPSHVQVVMPGKSTKERPRLLAPRIVAVSGQDDWALIHVTGASVATPLSAQPPVAGMPVLASGYSPHRQAITVQVAPGRPGPLPSGGRVTAIKRAGAPGGGHPECLAIDHTAIIMGGDSGGPVFDGRGGLIGVTVRGSSAYPLLGMTMRRQYSTAIQVPSGFLEQTIRTDRRRRPGSVGSF